MMRTQAQNVSQKIKIIAIFVHIPLVNHRRLKNAHDPCPF